MTEHVLECRWESQRCICEELRACEQWAEEAWSAIAGRDQYAEGYAAALDAAREAVEQEWAEDPSWDGTNWNNALTVALDAIDELKEKP